MYKSNRVGVAIPALNEEQSIGVVIDGLLARHNIDGSTIVDEIVVCDNGSEDRTAQVAQDHGATVITEHQKGYGRACLAALAELEKKPPDIVVFIDGDNAFDCSVIETFLKAVIVGADLVIGARTKGNMEPRALSASQIFGNRLATLLIRMMWQVSVSDLGPYRAIRYSSLNRLNMQDEAFGWTIEMQIKAIQLGLKVVEIPVDTKVRVGESKISGTLSGVIGAGYGILTTILKLRLQQGLLLQRSFSEN